MTVRIISILAVAITIGPSLAYGSPACMTESEARAKFPKAHLVWVGTNHCWIFGTAPVHSTLTCGSDRAFATTRNRCSACAFPTTRNRGSAFFPIRNR